MSYSSYLYIPFGAAQIHIDDTRNEHKEINLAMQAGYFNVFD